MPEWKRAASALKGIVKVGAVDADTHKSLGQQYGVSGFPTIKVFGSNKRSPTNYQGGRTADAIVEQALNQVRSIVNERLGKRGGSNDGGSSGNGGKDAIDLTDSNFQVIELAKIVFLSFHLVFVFSCLVFSRLFSTRKTRG